MPRRKIPTKAELIQLQKLYKTDEKIAERLGNVSPQLVAYWRRKKNIPKHSFPKFSEPEVRELWERYGDDYRCGLELGLSKAAFYNWRRRYGIKQKPAFLKLEQLELDLGAPSKKPGRKHLFGQQTIIQKMLMSSAGREDIVPGDVIAFEPDLVMAHVNAVEVIAAFKNNGHSHVWNAGRIAISMDWRSRPPENNHAGYQKTIRDFVRVQNIRHFFDFREGVCHQVILEKGLVLPGQMALGTDTLTTVYGAIGACGLKIDIAAMAAVWANGSYSVTVPETIKIIINGKMPHGVGARDVAMFIVRKLAASGAKGKAVEFYGSAVTQMTISDRVALSTIAAEIGAVTTICPFDTVTRRYFVNRTHMPFRPALSDKDAVYDESYELNIDQIRPQISGPYPETVVRSVGEVGQVPVHHVIIGSITTGRFDDLRVAADIIKGHQVHRDTQLYIFPGSRSIYLEAVKKGLIRAFLEAGAIVMNPGSAGEFFLNQIRPSSGEVCLTTSGQSDFDLNIIKGSAVYSVSPATAALSAVKGVISDPSEIS
jgi:homoaconitase/3-isopropylmalate dehydratase large subunit